MPTKPATTFTFATDAVFGSGPATGFPTKIIPPSLLQGFIPGNAISAEHTDYLHHWEWNWIDQWLALGSFNADEDAHIVETDTDGLISATRLNVGGSTVAGVVSSITATAKTDGAAPTVAIDYSIAGGPNRALFVTQSSAASAVSAAFVQNTDGSGEAALLQTSGANTGDALAVSALAAAPGRGVVITTNDGNPAPLRLVGRTAPAAPALGDLYVDDTTNEERLRVYHSGQLNSVWTTAEGIARGYNESLGETSFSAGGGLVAKVSVAFAASAGLVAGTTVHLRGVAEVGCDIASATAANVGLRDQTAAVDIVAARNVRVFHATGAADERYVVIEADYTLPLSGARTFFLGYTGNGVDTAYIRNASLEITGQY